MAQCNGAWRTLVLAIGSSAVAWACSPHTGTDNNGKTISAGGAGSAGETGNRGGSGNKPTGGGAATGQDPGAGGVMIGPIATQMPPSNSPDASCAKASATA